MNGDTKPRGIRSISRRAAYIAGYAFVCIFTFVVCGCGIDRDYLFFLNAEPPSEFRVTVANAGAVSVCGGSNNLTISITAINEDGTTNTDFRRAVKLSLLDENEKQFSISPPKSPDFTNGTASVGDVTLPTVPTGAYVVRAVDEGNSRITGLSESFPLDVSYVDHLEVLGLPATIQSGSSYGLTVRAVNQTGGVFTDFDGYVDLRATNDYTIDPARIKLSSGSLFTYVTISGSGAFSISPRLSDTQGDDVSCTGGLEPGEGGGGDDGDGDGDGGGGSDADGDGEGDATSTAAEASNLTCTLTAPANDVLKGTGFTMYLTLTKTDQNGGSYPVFSGNVGFTPAGIGLDPTAMAIASLNISQLFTISTTGVHTVTANVSDNDSALTCSCSDNVTIVEGIAVYGDYASELVTKLETEITDKDFFVVNSISSASIAPYTALIVNLAGSGYGIVARGDLTSAEAAAIKAFYDGGAPIFIAHDNITTGAGSAKEVLVDPVWGATTIVDIDFKIDKYPFVHEVASPVYAASPTSENLEEVFISGFTNSGSSAVVTTQYQSVIYSLILARTTGTRAVLAGEAIWHPFGGDENLETQWWDGAGNRAIVVALINWMLQ